MAERDYTQKDFNFGYPASIIVWTGLKNGDTGKPYYPLRAGQGSVHILGTFGVGGSVTIQGSNELGSVTSWITLEDLWGDNLTFGAAGLKQLGSYGCKIRPSVTAGDETTSLTAIIFCQII